MVRMMEAAGRTFGDMDHAMPLVEQLVYEQCTKDCRRAIAPWKAKGLQAWMKACREVGGPLSNSGLAAAVLAAAKTVGKGRGGCFRCGQEGHYKKQCPNNGGESKTGNRKPDVCPRCKKGKHWANECRSVKDIHGQPITTPQGPKNGNRGPRPQGPRIYGALQNPSFRPPSQPGEQPQAPQGWTSVPPPEWY